MAADVGSVMDGILACLETALTEAGRGVCRTGATVGAPVLGPQACCKNKACDGAGGQLSGTLQRLYPIDASTFGQVAKIQNCTPGAVGADLAFTVARCHAMLDAQGKYPSLDSLAPYADGAHEDAQILWNALMCCTDYKLVVRDLGINSDPVGGCSAVGVRVTVLVKPVSPTPDVS